MFKRDLEQVIRRLATFYPIIGITGPRQSGKTTLAKMIFPHLPYVSLENLNVRTQAQLDPLAFLKAYENGAIFDEVQHVPELLSYLQGIVDADQRPGRYVLTGSQNFALNAHISQSLSGRIGMTTLLPLNAQELAKPLSITERIFSGGYPGLHYKNMHPLDFYPSYIETYVDRDVRQIKNIEQLGRFQTFIKLCAGRIGQVVNLSSLGQDCGVSHTTVRQWLTILEASYLIFSLQPFYENFSRRLVKMPKLYFYDTGLACSLLGLENQSQLETHYLRSGLYENLVILELLKARQGQGLPPNLYFWRDLTGHEVDCIGEWGGSIKAIEIKYGTTFQPDFIKSVQSFCSYTNRAVGYLVYNGDQRGMVNGIHLTPLEDIKNILG